MKKPKNNPESNPLRVLILEDNPADAELVKRELKRSGLAFSSHVVDGKREFKKALTEVQPQVILSDFKLPRFDGLAALKMAHQQAPDTPFIFVSGSIGEEQAIETLALGASDYIFKDNLQRLVPAVMRAIEEARLKSEKAKTDEELRRHAEDMRLLAEAADRFVHLNNLDHLYDYLAQVIRGISGADYLLLSLYDEKRQGLQPKVLDGITPFQELLRRQLGRAPEETILLLKDMSPAEFEDFVSRKLLPAREGLFTLTDRTTPRSICLLIEKTMGITALYTMGFSWENQLFGGLALAFKKGKDLRNRASVEAVVNLAAVAIKRLLAEKLLRKSEEKYRLIADNTAETITVLDMNLRFTYVSPSIFKLRGYTVEEALQLTMQQTMTPESLVKVQAVLAEEMALEAGGKADPQRSRTLELQEYHKDGFIIWVENTMSFLRNPQGQAEGFLAVSKNISERKQAESQREAALKALRESEYQYRSLIDNIPDIIFTIDLKGKITFVSRRIKEILGYKNTDLIHRNIFNFIPEEDHQNAMENLQKGMQGEKIKHFQVPMIAKSGERLFFECSFSRVFKDGAVVGAQGTAVDITERKQAEELIRSSLKEKEVLLQEIHHRVKNNLQIISGLLTLQAGQSAGKSLEEIFSVSQDRIRSIALIHEKLYRSHSLAEIAFDEYLRALSANLLSSQGIAAGRITVSYDTEPIHFTIEKAIPLGLIVNELVTNALKHAFPDGRQGEIRIGLHGYEGAKSYDLKTNSGTLHVVPTCELTVADNGVGLPAGQVPEQQKSLGMKLVSMLAQQLQARLKVRTGEGTEFRLIFPGLPAQATVEDNSHGR